MEENKLDLTVYVVALRQYLGESQTQFAARIGAGMSTVQRYERISPEIGEVPRMLSRLALLARENGRDDIADAFEQPIRALLTTPCEPEPAMVQMARRLQRIRQSAEERDWQHLMDLVEITERLGKMKK